MYIGANISTMSQVVGSAISIFTLSCNGSEAKPDDCLLERQSSAFSNCQRTIIQCFATNPDPQLCNIFLLTTMPEYKITASDSTTVEASVTPPLATTTNLEALTDLGLVRHTTAAEGTHENISSITNMPTIGVVITILLMVVVLMSLASLIMVYFMVRQRKKGSQKSQLTERSKQEQMEPQTLDNARQCAVITECKQGSQKQGMESAYQYTKNNAYGSRPMQTNQQPGGDQQQDVEPIYETVPDPILKSHTTK